MLLFLMRTRFHWFVVVNIVVVVVVCFSQETTADCLHDVMLITLYLSLFRLVMIVNCIEHVIWHSSRLTFL